MQNVGVVTVGAAGVAILNYFANDRPVQQHIIGLLNSIKQGQTKVNLTPLISGLEYMVDYIDAQMATDFSLRPQMQLARQKRLLAVAQAEQLKEQANQAELSRLLGYRKKSL